MNTVVIFDTETTGINDPVIVEAAYIIVDIPDLLTKEYKFCSRYNPGKPIELGAMATHHILDEDLVDYPPASEFKLPEGTDYIIGHNVDFDWKVIGSPADIKRICTLALSRWLFPTLDSHTQSSMVYYFMRAEATRLLKNAHSAAEDVGNCYLVLYYLLNEMEKRGIISLATLTWEELWQISEKARIPTIMAFGKHKGMAIKDLPMDYKRWLLNQSEIDPYLIKALRGEK